eukprot:gene2281-2860_t
MLALMAIVLTLGLTGWMQTLDTFFGEAWLQDLHGLAADGLIALAFGHALAAIVMGRLERTRLIRAMGAACRTAISPTLVRPAGREPLALPAHAVHHDAGVPSLLTRSASPAILACGGSGKQQRDSSMNYSIALAAALAVFTLSACDRTPAVAPTVITVP